MLYEPQMLMICVVICAYVWGFAAASLFLHAVRLERGRFTRARAIIRAVFAPLVAWCTPQTRAGRIVLGGHFCVRRAVPNAPTDPAWVHAPTTQDCPFCRLREAGEWCGGKETWP